MELMELFKELVLRVIIIVALTDALIFYVMQKRGMTTSLVTWQFVALVIIVTIVPIVISLWWCLIFKQKI